MFYFFVIRKKGDENQFSFIFFILLIPFNGLHFSHNIELNKQLLFCWPKIYRPASNSKNQPLKHR